MKYPIILLNEGSFVGEKKRKPIELIIIESEDESEHILMEVKTFICLKNFLKKIKRSKRSK